MLSRTVALPSPPPARTMNASGADLTNPCERPISGRESPMALYNFHRVLISCAILFSFGYGLFACRQFQGADGRAVDLITALVAGLLSVVMVGYLIYFNYHLR